MKPVLWRCVAAVVAAALLAAGSIWWIHRGITRGLSMAHITSEVAFGD